MPDPVADVDPDLEAAAEALWRWEHGQRAWSEVAPFAADAYRSAAAAVLAALRAADWQKADDDWTYHDALTAIAAARQEADEWDQPSFDWRMLARKMESIARRALAEGPVGEMGAAQAEPEPPTVLQRVTEALEWAGESAENMEILRDSLGASEPVAAPRSHAVLGDETSPSGGVGIPSAAVPEQPSWADGPCPDPNVYMESEVFVAGSLSTMAPFDVFHPAWALPFARDALEALNRWEPTDAASPRGVSDSEAGQ